MLCLNAVAFTVVKDTYEDFTRESNWAKPDVRSTMQLELWTTTCFCDLRTVIWTSKFVKKNSEYISTNQFIDNIYILALFHAVPIVFLLIFSFLLSACVRWDTCPVLQRPKNCLPVFDMPANSTLRGCKGFAPIGLDVYL